MQKAEYRNAIRSKQLIHNAIAELLHEKPLDKITVSDVLSRLYPYPVNVSLN